LRLADALPWPHRSPPAPVPPPEPEALDGLRLPQWAFREMLRCNPAAMLGAACALGRFTSHEWVGTIDVPTAVVITKRDQLVSPAGHGRLPRALAGATVHGPAPAHAACVLGPRRFVPALVEACGSVADRVDGARRVA